MIDHWYAHIKLEPCNRNESLREAPVVVQSIAQNANGSQTVSRSQNATLSQDKGRLVYCGAHGKHIEHIDCSDSVLKNLAYTLLIDNEKVTVEKILQCRINIHERKRTQGHGLTIQVCPCASVVTPQGVLEKATESILSWIRRALQAEPPKLSSYLQISNGDLLASSYKPREKVQSYQMVDSGVQTNESAPVDVRVPISLVSIFEHA